MMGQEQDPLDFMLAQVKANLEYLQSKGRVTEGALRQINDLLAEAPRSGVAVAPSAPQYRAPSFSTPAAPPPPPPQAQPNQPQLVRALYDYNVSSSGT